MRACVRACVHACVCVRLCVWLATDFPRRELYFERVSQGAPWELRARDPRDHSRQGTELDELMYVKRQLVFLWTIPSVSSSIASGPLFLSQALASVVVPTTESADRRGKLCILQFSDCSMIVLFRVLLVFRIHYKYSSI